MTTPQVTQANARHFWFFSNTIESIIDKKVRNIALSCFEKIIDFFYNCFSPTYRRLCQTRVVLTPAVPTVAISRALQQNIAEAQAAVPPRTTMQPSIKECQRGSLFGQGIGDALGLLTEFRTKREALSMIRGRPLNYALKTDPAFTRGERGQWMNRFPPGWTDDTDQAILLVRAKWLKQNDPNFAQYSLSQIFAQQLHHWVHHGLDGFHGQFQTRATPGCNGLGRLVGAVTAKPHFTTNPEQAAYETWVDPTFSAGPNMRGRPAANGALMRTAPVGLIHYNNLSKTVEQARLYSKVTHTDPRAVASSVTVSVALALLVQGMRNVDGVIYHASQIGKQVLLDEIAALAPQENGAEYVQEFDRYINIQNWDELALDQQDSMGYTYKCMGAAFFALRSASRILLNPGQLNPAAAFRSVMQRLISEGGDADTNAAVAGALLGAYLGEDSIPRDWRDNLADLSVMRETQNMIVALSR